MPPKKYCHIGFTKTSFFRAQFCAKLCSKLCHISHREGQYNAMQITKKDIMRRIGGITTLHHKMSITIPLHQEQNSIIGSALPWTSLKCDMRVVKAFAMVSGWQCWSGITSISNMLEEWPESPWSLLLVACNHTWYLASHDGCFGPYRGPKDKNKDSSHCRYLL